MAYMPARFVDLINKYTKHAAYLIQIKSFFTGNPLQIPMNNRLEEAKEKILKSKVVHFHGSRIFDRRKFLGYNISSLLRGRKIVLHYHGTPQREHPQRFQRKNCHRLLVSTPEMLPLFPNARYFPNLIDEKHKSLYIPASNNDEKIKICHHFSLHKNKKDTSIFESVQQKNQREDFVFEYIPQMNLDLAIKERSKYDCVLDHFQGYYGLVSIEAMSQGIAVINCCTSPVEKAIIKFFGKLPPFIKIKKQDFSKNIYTFSKNDFKVVGEKSKEFMENYWSGEKNINKLINIYENL